MVKQLRHIQAFFSEQAIPWITGYCLVVRCGSGMSEGNTDDESHTGPEYLCT